MGKCYSLGILKLGWFKDKFKFGYFLKNQWHKFNFSYFYTACCWERSPYFLPRLCKGEAGFKACKLIITKVGETKTTTITVS